MNKQIIFIIYVLVIIFFKNTNANFIRDHEIESFLSSIISKKLDKFHEIKFIVINDNSLNAFVAGGNTVYINSGVFSKVDNYQQIAGIIGHEIAHMRLGHIVRIDDKINESKKLMLLAYACSALLAVVSKGNMEAASALLHGGTQMAQSNVLYSMRNNETSADINAIDYMVEMGYNPQEFIGLLNNMSKEDLFTINQNKYLLTHPLNSERIEYISSYIESKASKAKHTVPADYEKQQQKFKRIRAKIEAFTENIDIVKNKYKDNSCLSQYAQSIIKYREGNIKQSIAIMSNIKNNCYINDPYINEIEGYFLYHLNMIEESKNSYNAALLGLGNEATLIMLEFAEVLKESGKKEDLKLALKTTKRALEIENENLFAWKLLGEIYYKKNEQALSYLALAEYNILIAQHKLAKHYIYLAKKYDNKKKQHHSARIKEIETMLSKTKT